MDFFQTIKTDLSVDIENSDFALFSNKLDFDMNNIYKYVGFNYDNIDYSSTYLIDKKNNKKQLNLMLIHNDEIEKIIIIKNNIIIKKKNKNIIVFTKDNNIITTFIKNLYDIFRIDKFKTCIFGYKNYDFYNLLKCKKRYSYFYENN
jgi:hypothetical protein